MSCREESRAAAETWALTPTADVNRAAQFLCKRGTYIRRGVLFNLQQLCFSSFFLVSGSLYAALLQKRAVRRSLAGILLAAAELA